MAKIQTAVIEQKIKTEFSPAKSMVCTLLLIFYIIKVYTLVVETTEDALVFNTASVIFSFSLLYLYVNHTNKGQSTVGGTPFVPEL